MPAKAYLIFTFVLLALVNFPTAQAKRWVVPEDENVLHYVNEPSRSSLNPKSIKVLVWNMYKGQKEDWSVDYPEFINGKDILLLQEVYLDSQMLNIFKKNDEGQSFAYQMAISFYDTKKGNIPTGVAIASSVKPKNIAWLRSFYREPFIKTPKMAMLNRYSLKGLGPEKDLITANIHTINIVSSRKAEHHIKAVIDALLLLKDHPIVFAGDFNTWSEKKIKMLYRQMKRLDLNEVMFPEDEDGRMRTFDHIIDYIFVSKSVKIIAGTPKVYGDSEGSDHKALEIEISIK